MLVIGISSTPFLELPGSRHMKWRSLSISHKKLLQDDLVNVIFHSAVLCIFLTLLRVHSAHEKRKLVLLEKVR